MIALQERTLCLRYQVYIPDRMTWEETEKILDMAIRQDPPSLCYNFKIETIPVKFEKPRHYILMEIRPGNEKAVNEYISALSEDFDQLCREYLRIKEYRDIMSTVPVAPIQGDQAGAEA